MEIFTVKNLTFTYPETEKPVLRQVNLSILPGEFVLICGKSGSGKTTLLRHLKPQLTPFGKREGELLFRQKALAQLDLRTASSAIGFVMQNPERQIVTDKVWHELAFGLESLGCDQKTMRIRVAEMANFFGIQSWFHRDVRELSGGQKQLLNLASVMAMQPEVLILDEPTSQLDPIAAGEFFQILQKINRELGTTVVLSEHRLEEVFPVADRVIVLAEGRVLADDCPASVGNILRETNDDMTAALPTPMQIFYGIGGEQNAPLTVRDGKKWLAEQFAGKQPVRLREKALPEGQPVLQARELWFRYGKETPDILKGVSFTLHSGRLSAVIGGNGAGKSTLLKCLCRIHKPYRGKITLLGKKLGSFAEEELFHQGIAMLPQDPQNLFVKKTVREELEEMNRDYAQAAADCELDGLLDIHPYDLSGGEAQRAALAKVLLCEPRVLLLDEPTKGMDNFFKEKFARILHRLTGRGAAILLVSHDVEFCARYADEVSLFFDGEILTTGTPGQFFSGNSFYTTAANRMCRSYFENAVTSEEVIAAWRESRE